MLDRATKRLRTSMAQVHADPKRDLDVDLPVAAPERRKSLRFIAGTVLMAGSFLVYPSYPVILLWLPVSARLKALLSVAVWIISWGTFSLGALLAGPEGYAWFKGLWRQLRTAYRRKNSSAGHS